MGIDPYGKFESLRKSSIRFGCCFDFCNSGRLRRGNAAFGETFGENFMHMVADFRCRLVGGDLACRNHVQNVKVDVSFPAEHVLENRLRVRQRAYDNRNARLLRDFERAVAERLEKA